MDVWGLRKLFNFLGIKRQKNASSIANSLSVLKIPQGKKILFIAPHPDDETISAGGFLYEATKRQNETSIILISGGEKWGPKETRLKEFHLACKNLNISLNNTLFLGLPDKYSKNPTNRIKIYRAIHKTFKEIGPDYIIYPSEFDLDRDHKMIGQIMHSFKKGNAILLSYLIHYVAFPKPYRFKPVEFLVPPSKLLKHHWYAFPLNDESIEKKHEAMLNYRTQLSVPGIRNLLLSFIRQNEIFIKNDL